MIDIYQGTCNLGLSICLSSCIPGLQIDLLLVIYEIADTVTVTDDGTVSVPWH